MRSSIGLQNPDCQVARFPGKKTDSTLAQPLRITRSGLRIRRLEVRLLSGTLRQFATFSAAPWEASRRNGFAAFVAFDGCDIRCHRATNASEFCAGQSASFSPSRSPRTIDETGRPAVDASVKLSSEGSGSDPITSIVRLSSCENPEEKANRHEKNLALPRWRQLGSIYVS